MPNQLINSSTASNSVQDRSWVEVGLFELSKNMVSLEHDPVSRFRNSYFSREMKVNVKKFFGFSVSLVFMTERKNNYVYPLLIKQEVSI